MEWSANVWVVRHCVELGVCALGILGIALQERCPVRGCVRTPGVSDHGRLRARAFAVVCHVSQCEVELARDHRSLCPNEEPFEEPLERGVTTNQRVPLGAKCSLEPS